MKVFLRLVATLNGIAFLAALMLVGQIVSIGLGGPGLPLSLGLLSIVSLAAYATVQLWRLQQAGRYATLGLFLLWGTLSVVEVVVRQSLSFGPILRLALVLLLGSALLLPAAKRACTHNDDSRELGQAVEQPDAADEAKLRIEPRR